MFDVVCVNLLSKIKMAYAANLLLFLCYICAANLLLFLPICCQKLKWSVLPICCCFTPSFAMVSLHGGLHGDRVPVITGYGDCCPPTKVGGDDGDG